MRYENIKNWKDTDFKRLTGVKRELFEKMRVIINQELPSFGRPPKLKRADQLLMTLMYWRAYRTQFHIAGSYGVSEATVCQIEAALVSSGEFRLPGKPALQPSDTVIEIVLIDAREQPIERPKKSKSDTTAAKRSAIHKKHKSWSI